MSDLFRSTNDKLNKLTIRTNGFFMDANLLEDDIEITTEEKKVINRKFIQTRDDVIIHHKPYGSQMVFRHYSLLWVDNKRYLFLPPQMGKLLNGCFEDLCLYNRFNLIVPVAPWVSIFIEELQKDTFDKTRYFFFHESDPAKRGNIRDFMITKLLPLLTDDELKEHSDYAEHLAFTKEKLIELLIATQPHP